MSSTINNIVQSIEDSQTARIKLTVRGGNQHYFECVYKEDSSPHFYLVFKPGTLPDDIDLRQDHPVSIRQEATTVSLNATIIKLKGDRTLHLQAKGTVDPASLREYFRINTTTEVTVSHTSTLQQGPSANWTITGKTQDISGSGVLALFDDEPRSREHLIIELYLPDKKHTVNGVGHLVRKKRLRSKKWQVSFHFDTISQKHRDLIITYLLSVQRKQLRENVRAFD